MPGVSYCTQFRSLLLCTCDAFWALINSLWWFYAITFRPCSVSLRWHTDKQDFTLCWRVTVLLSDHVENWFLRMQQGELQPRHVPKRHTNPSHNAFYQNLCIFLTMMVPPLNTLCVCVCVCVCVCDDFRIMQGCIMINRPSEKLSKHINFTELWQCSSHVWFV